MSNEAQITLTGNACADADLRFTTSGVAVAGVTVAVTPREKDGDSWKDGNPAFYRISAWRQMAENVTESIHKGDRVTVVGRLKPREYDHEGTTRTSLDVEADSIALDLRFHTAVATKAQRSQGGQQQPQGRNEGGNYRGTPQPRPTQPGDGWATNQPGRTQGDGWGNHGDDSAPF